MSNEMIPAEDEITAAYDRIEELERQHERDVATLECWNKAITELQADNERLRDALTKSIEFVPAGYGIERECWSAIHDTPKQSLARIRNRVREECAGICDRFGQREMHPAECASAIRASKEEE